MKTVKAISHHLAPPSVRMLALLTFITAAVGLLVFTAQRVAVAQSSVWSLGGEAQVINNSDPPNPVAFELSSRCLEPGGVFGCIEGDRLTRSGIVFTPPPGHILRFQDLFRLSTDFNPTETDCGAGSPRFEIGLDLTGDGLVDGSLFVYLGPQYNFTNCLRGWQSSGNLIADISSDQRYDLTQFGGPFYGTYFEALTLVGRGAICYILLVVDSGWWPQLQPKAGTQIIHVDNVRVNQFTLKAINPPTTAPVELQSPDAPSDAPDDLRGPQRRIRLSRSLGAAVIK